MLDEKLKKIIQDLQQANVQSDKYSWDGCFLHRKGKIMVGKNMWLRRELFSHFHANAVGGHSGVLVTKKRLTSLLFWKGLTTDVKRWIRECLVCQKCKSETVASPGLLQPLPTPNRAWSVISLDFIEGLPKSSKKNSILVVVDHLTKYGHFLGLSRPYTTQEVAQEYMTHVYKLHGMPDSIISDRDKIFVSKFWQELFHRSGTKLLLSIAYHPQMDGQTEVLNCCLESYLRCMTGETPTKWFHWLPLAE